MTTQAAPAPATLDDLLTLLGPDNRADPYPAYQRWRESTPIAQVGEQAFVFSRHAEATAVLRSADFGHAEPGAQGPFGRTPDNMPRDEDGKPVRAFLRMNPPDHTRLRRLVSKAFTRPMVAELTPRIETITADLIAQMQAKAGPVDLIEDFAYPLPVSVISELLGIPESDRERFVAWSHHMARGLDPEFLLSPELLQQLITAREEFGAYIRELAEVRRGAPGDDLLSALVAVHDSGDVLSQTELVSTCILLLIAGHETTVNLIGNGTVALLRNPDQLALLRERPDLADRAVEELLRYDSPVQMTARTALVDTELAGVPIPAGTMNLLLIGSANRDPESRTDPERLNIEREPGKHLAFGQGIHFCLGAPLAKVEAQIAFTALLEAAPDLRLAGEPEWKDNLVLRGMSNLPVQL